MQRKPKLSDIQGWENTHKSHTNTKALEWIWTRESDLGTGPRVKWFSRSRSVMLSSYKRVMLNILCLTDILWFPGRADVDFRASD